MATWYHAHTYLGGSDLYSVLAAQLRDYVVQALNSVIHTVIPITRYFCIAYTCIHKSEKSGEKVLDVFQCFSDG